MIYRSVRPERQTHLPGMEINGRASVARADVEMVIRVKRHTRLLDAIQGRGRGAAGCFEMRMLRRYSCCSAVNLS